MAVRNFISRAYSSYPRGYMAMIISQCILLILIIVIFAVQRAPIAWSLTTLMFLIPLLRVGYALYNNEIQELWRVYFQLAMLFLAGFFGTAVGTMFHLTLETPMWYLTVFSFAHLAMMQVALALHPCSSEFE